MPNYKSYQCSYCKKTFHVTLKNNWNQIKRSSKNRFCSQKCKIKNQTTIKEIECKQCQKKFFKLPNQIKKSKNNFCSQSCAAIYNNAHKKTGTRRSKNEIWLEEQLTILYPDLPIDFNKKDAINSELDIYIPSLKLSFELNGIYHYEPIHGIKKMDQIQNNDHRKYAACIENNIELCIIDTSQQKYFKPKTSQKFLDIITSILDSKLAS